MNQLRRRFEDLVEENRNLKEEIKSLKSRLVLNSTMVPSDPSFVLERTSISSCLIRLHVDSVVINRHRMKTRSKSNSNSNTSRLIKFIDNKWMRC